MLKTGIARPRTIKVQVTNAKIKTEIFKNIGKLKPIVAWKGVHLSDALTPKEQKQAKDLRCIFALGKAEKLDIKLRGKVIIIDGIRFTPKEKDSLPYDLSMETAKIIPVDDGVAFQSEYAYLSIMYITVIKYDGEVYPSSEHLYSAEFV